MSKAIYGHMGAGDALLAAEIGRLRRRVSELEEQVAAYEAELLTSGPRIVSLRDTELDAALRELGTETPALT